MSVLSTLKRHLQRKFKSLSGIPLQYTASSVLAKQWSRRAKLNQRSHNLAGELIVNLTSYPPRFETLHLTLKSLLLQQVAADKVVLWLYQPDYQQLPADVLALEQQGLTINLVDQDIKSYKKLIPALQDYPDAYHVTADDDIYYRNDWLAELLAGYQGGEREVVCLRAHYITLDSQSNFQPYRFWQAKTEQRGPDNRLFFTSGAGALFPPGALHPDATDADKFCRLSPHGDDIWLYWMATLNGCAIHRTGSNKKLIVWKSSKAVTLWQLNKQPDSGNDFQINNMVQEYGQPTLDN
ncbi:glycosyltransferase family 2 protein [Arsukibacterium perlucidum]|uniref:glycosyltransferase family 2 protein n=1 Tax=Arsukibacterium perlucidum TaxID=368811 RepID=UPI0003A364FB|nr:glycosyltransferase family 2 protein [Arsukibacterium perlucidum]